MCLSVPHIFYSKGSPDTVQLFTADMHNHGRGEGIKQKKKKRRVKHHIHTALYIVFLLGILMGVLVLGLIFSCYTQRKQPQLIFSKGPLRSCLDCAELS